MILKLGMYLWGLKLYKVYIIDDPGFTLTFLWQGQIGSPVRLNGENVTKSFNGGKLAAKDYID